MKKSQFRETKGKNINDKESDLLGRKISDLSLKIQGTGLEALINTLYRELEKAGISFKPKTYQTQLKVPALVEEYIEGREFYLSVLGNDPAEALPVMELDFTKLPDGFPKIYGHEAKSDAAGPQYRAVNAVVATDHRSNQSTDNTTMPGGKRLTP